jgi:hypothetical protein
MHAPRVRQLIVLHDTTVDGAVGEAVRLGQGVGTLAQAAGWPERDVAEGIWPAVMRVPLAAVPSFRVPNFNFNFNSTLALLSACALGWVPPPPLQPQPLIRGLRVTEFLTRRRRLRRWLSFWPTAGAARASGACARGK